MNTNNAKVIFIKNKEGNKILPSEVKRILINTYVCPLNCMHLTCIVYCLYKYKIFSRIKNQLILGF